MNKKNLLSTLWILAALNYLFRFVFSLYFGERLAELLDGNLHGMPVTQGLLLGMSVMMEIPIVMILLSRLLNHKPNRILNIIIPLVVGAVHLSSMFSEGVTLHFYFFSMIGTIIYISIVGIAYQWKEDDGPSAH